MLDGQAPSDHLPEFHREAVAAWSKPAPSACSVCIHGVGPDDNRSCSNEALVGRYNRPVEGLRKNESLCGTEAKFLKLRGE